MKADLPRVTLTTVRSSGPLFLWRTSSPIGCWPIGSCPSVVAGPPRVAGSVASPRIPGSVTSLHRVPGSVSHVTSPPGSHPTSSVLLQWSHPTPIQLRLIRLRAPKSGLSSFSPSARRCPHPATSCKRGGFIRHANTNVY